MKVVTWNLNSIRARFEHVVKWLESNEDVDVLCLQETKVTNDDFPLDYFEDQEYYVYIHGQPSYNGVAFISRVPLDDVKMGFPDGDLDDQKRVISCTLEGVKIINVYCPQGESPDSPKFDFKRRFYASLSAWLENEFKADQDLVICGDMNISPGDLDVHSVEKMTGRCMFTDEEKQWWAKLENWGLKDAFRTLYPENGSFSWWDYRQGSFQKDKGLRIDHFLVTNSVMKKSLAVDIDSEPRGWERPSDHVPVTLTIG